MSTNTEWKACITTAINGIFARDRIGSGQLIVVCGFDASGKSTQVDALARSLEAMGKRIVKTRQPTTWYREQPEVRDFLDKGIAEGRIRQLALMAAADRLRHVENVIKPALARGEYVICDRYVFATLALFMHRGIDPAFLTAINSGIPRPDHAFYLDVPVPILRERLRQRDGTNLKYEERSAETIQSIIDIYKASHWPLTFVDGCKPQERITADLLTNILAQAPGQTSIAG